MNRKSVLIVIGLFLVSATCLAAENPNVSNPLRQSSVENPNAGNSLMQPSNTPTHSGQQQRFITQPGSNSYGKVSNDIVTGNVGGGKHFRGFVPYGSSYYSGAYSRSSGTRSVNHFIRRSADPFVNDRNPGQTSSYYNPRWTVTSMRRPDGTSGLLRPQMTGQGRKMQYVMPPIDPVINTRYQQRPLSTNNTDLEQILARREQLREQAKKDADTLDQEKIEKKNFFDLTLIPEEDEKEDEKDGEKVSVDKPEPALKPEQQVYAEFQKEHAEAIENQQSIRDGEVSDDAPQAEKKPRDYASPQSDLLPDLNDMIDTAEGRKILGKHETFAALAEEKFATYMNAAEDFVAKGQFYKAADTYALAIVWKPKNAQGYLGQSFSLFAAGEYMSSAYYLSRAMELDSKEALRKYDLAAFVGGRDVFESRALEMATWQQRSGSGELAFLLAYVSYQDEKAVLAKSAINTAKDAMPDSKAVTLLKNIIDPEEVLK
ncbi:MAG: tetratricopeptide repeat protein [Planctomycetota bacterium]|jgi:hypothetical protein